ncbi:hypothetical protein [Mycobacterium sp. AT1]|uniref:hypothetical protein n=1 Tax=Mycobacterium sp. AT1 TaxID=1961706 RepID=UPI0009ACCA1A|nr:hypothetical protein [Mycobacterium sp. AT1]OPX08346.1 hypothetical protein B1790_19810 [Mycobacterium sp. AT1]
MSTVRLKRLSDFKGDDVVLLAVDDGGLAALVAALMAALQTGTSRMQRRERSHEFVIVDDGITHIAIDDACALWRLDRVKAREIIAKAKVLGVDGQSGHHYVDEISSPAPTLVLSLNEYLEPTWHGIARG